MSCYASRNSLLCMLINQIHCLYMPFCGVLKNKKEKQKVSWETAYLRRKSIISSKVFLMLSEIKLSNSQMDDESMIRLDWLIWQLWSQFPPVWNTRMSIYRCIKHDVDPYIVLHVWVDKNNIIHIWAKTFKAYGSPETRCKM